MRVLFLIAVLVATTLAGCASVEDPEAAQNAPAAPVATPVPGAEIAVPPGVYNFTGPYSRVLIPGALDILPPVRVNLPSDIDGENIEIALWLPDGEGPFPVMLFSSPYFFAPAAGSRPVDNPGGAVQNLINQLVPHGYAFATHAVRGTAGSDGCNDLMGPLETRDIDQAVTWLGTQAWSNGNLAMTGVSYDGSTPWGAASLGNPHLKTIVPISGVPDMHGLMYRNGSSESRGPALLNALYIAGGVTSADPSDIPGRLICPDAYQGLVLSGVAATTGYDPTGWWQERNRKAGVEANYKGSVFSVQGLQDWNVDPSQVVPWVDQLEAQGIKTKQLLGQWGHAWPDGIGTDGARADTYRADHNEILLRWLNSELKGQDVSTGPAVQVMDTLGRWRNEAHFPPHDIDWMVLGTSAQGVLVEDGAQEGRFVLLPNAVGTVSPPGGANVPIAPMAVDFTMGPVSKDLLISGLPKVHVTIEPQGPGGYMAAYLYERTPAGEHRRIGWTTMNLLYAAGGTEPVPVVPGQPLDVKMEIQPMDAVVQKNNTLVLRLWVFTDGDRLPTLPPTGVTLLSGPESVLRLPVIERGPEYYFKAPAPAAA